MFDLFLPCLCFLRHPLTENEALPFKLGWLANEHQGSSCLCLSPALGWQGLSTVSASAAHTLPTEPPP